MRIHSRFRSAWTLHNTPMSFRPTLPLDCATASTHRSPDNEKPAQFMKAIGAGFSRVIVTCRTAK